MAPPRGRSRGRSHILGPHAGRFVRENADLIWARKRRILQSGEDADVLRLLPQLNAELAAEQASRGFLSEAARAVETMSIAEIDAELARGLM